MMPLFLLGVGLLAGAEQGKDKKAEKKPRATLEGTWTATKDEGKVILTFAGDKFTLTKSKEGKSEDVTGTFNIGVDREGKQPDQINMTVTGGTLKDLDKYKGKTSLGIIKLDINGDKLQWCANEPGKDVRPKMFADKDGDMRFLYVTFERAKK
jgi:uncharacterized protein (TIGR03067 family)